MKTIVLFSGGIDSLIAWFYLGKPDCLHINLGMPYSRKEEDIVRHFVQKEGMRCHFLSIPAPIEVSLENSFIPARNLALATIGSWFAPNVCIAGIKGDNVIDNNPKALSLMSDTISHLSEAKINVFSPFWDMTKGNIINWYIKSGNDPALLGKATGCYHPEEHQCGKCPCCLRKWVGLTVAGVNPGYDVDEKLKQRYLDRARGGHYVSARNEEIMKAIDLK